MKSAVLLLFLFSFIGAAKAPEELQITEKFQTILQEATSYMKTPVPVIIIDTDEQRLYVFEKEHLRFSYPVSTGKAGEGNQMYSLQTPLRFHVINEKIGANAPIGAIFKAKINIGKIAEIYTNKTDIKEDPVITRILSLDGLELGYNKGGKVDSYKRGIYIHGTHEEGLIGIKASHGCIRMYNNDVIELFDSVPIGTIVYIFKKNP